MARLTIVVPAQEFEFDLDDYGYEKGENGEWDMDQLYDGLIHEVVTSVDYDVAVSDV